MNSLDKHKCELNEPRAGYFDLPQYPRPMILGRGLLFMLKTHKYLPSTIEPGESFHLIAQVKMRLGWRAIDLGKLLPLKYCIGPRENVHSVASLQSMKCSTSTLLISYC